MTFANTCPDVRDWQRLLAGLAMGTPSYMPPEQAAGDWDIVDERADVFALGAILCEVLTDRPPYYGANRDDLLRRARRGDLAESVGRLAQCGADATLVKLCRECLAAERWQRPRHTGVVAERLAAYQAEVRERLRRAEFQRARAEVQAREQRKRRRLRAALALAASLLLAGAAALWWHGEKRQAEQERIAAERQAEADGAALQVMGEARLLDRQARMDPLNDVGYDKAVQAAAKAGEVGRAGGASETAQRQAGDLLTELRKPAEEGAKDRRFLAQLLEARGPREGPKYSRGDKDRMMAMAEPAAEEQFASAFRDWGLDVDAVPVAKSVARIKERPAAVVTEVIAGLDEWASQRRLDRKPEAARRLAALAAEVDDKPGSIRRLLREILARGRLPLERGLAQLSTALRPVPLPVPLGPDHARLRQLVENIDPTKEPVLGLLTLVRALRAVGEETRAEQLLRAAIVARPREVVLHHTLGQVLVSQQPPRWAAAVECYGAARTLRPDLGVNLATALRNSGRDDEGRSVLARLVSGSPTNPYLHFALAYALRAKGRLDEAVAEYRQAIALDPKYAAIHTSLGLALHDKGQLDEAIAEYRQAIALDPKDAAAHNNLGIVLRNKGQLDEAVVEYRLTIRLKPDYAEAHCNLGQVLQQQGRFDEALASRRLGHELGSKQPGWRFPSAQWVQTAERLLVLDKKLPAILSGEEAPANPSEAIALASLCQQSYQIRYAASARLYADAFAAEPKLATDLNAQHRYNAACSAALAAAGQGEDARLLPDKAAAMFRRWALDWMRADVKTYSQFVRQNNPQMRKAILQHLTHWRVDPDLASVRDPQALERLPYNERTAWQALWREVDELARLAAASHSKRGSPMNAGSKSRLDFPAEQRATPNVLPLTT